MCTQQVYLHVALPTIAGSACWARLNTPEYPRRTGWPWFGQGSFACAEVLGHRSKQSV